MLRSGNINNEIEKLFLERKENFGRTPKHDVIERKKLSQERLQ